MTTRKILSVCMALLGGLTGIAFAQSSSEGQPLRIEVTQGVVEPLSIALPQFVAETPNAAQVAADLTSVIAADLTGSGLFREIPRDAHIAQVTSFADPISFPDWKAINAKALVTGAVSLTAEGQLVVKFRLFDVLAEEALGKGIQFVATEASWRRMSHKVADVIYSRLTGEGGYFDSRVVYIAEEGPKNDRKKRLAIMDYDGANTRYLTGSDAIVLAPRFSPNARDVIYTSYDTGFPRVMVMNVDTLEKRVLNDNPDMSFAPRFSPDGRSVVMSLAKGANTDIFRVDLASGAETRLTDGPGIETAPSFSPDGRQIVFESDRAGGQQIYVMDAAGGPAQRISRGEGSYGTPVWSPRGDLIAFTKIFNGAFHIGVMGVDGSGERLLTRSFLDEGPSWSPNGRVIMFFRETPGADGAPSIHSVDLTGRIQRKVTTPTFGSDPNWSKLLE